MKSLSLSMILAFLTLSPVVVWAQSGGATRYQPCVTCHGEAAQGNAELGAPALASQDPAYLARQLQHFIDGIRGADPSDTHGAQMKAVTATLSGDDVEVLAEYISSLPTPELSTLATGDLKNGNNYYQAKCGACHGGQAQGNPGLNAPGLAWLDAEYLERQYRNFQQGLRGTHPKDTYGRQMKMMSTSLPSDKDLDDVIAYIQSLSNSQ